MTAALSPYVKIESVTLRCALGIRFRDTGANQIVGSGLRVRATPWQSPPGTEPVTGRANRSGVWLFYGLPGLHTYELGAEKFGETGSPIGPPRFRIDVEDEEGRFLPCTFQAAASEIGPFIFMVPASPPWPWSDVPLFSAPARPAPSGCALIHASFAMRTQDRGDVVAAGTLFQATATVRNRTIRGLGLSDKSGQGVIILPWPEPVGLALGSPPGGLKVEAQGWDFDFAAWHDFKESSARFADLDEILLRLGRQPDILSTPGPPLQSFSRGTLRYGRALVVPEQSPRLLIITPSASPL
jgi:hypothetical protein